jgi:hypothetical protein
MKHPDQIKKTGYSGRLSGNVNDTHVLLMNDPVSKPNTGLAGRFLPNFDSRSPVTHWDTASVKKMRDKRKEINRRQKNKREAMKMKMDSSK